jgi:tetratricopeptide (TPR) repeat protein
MLDFQRIKKEIQVTTPFGTLLTEAIAAARSGDRGRARELLARLLRSDSSNAEYWIWMSSVVDSERERIYCLESALRLDPTNRAAMRGLVILGAREPDDSEIAAAVRIPRRKYDIKSKAPVIIQDETTPMVEEKTLPVPALPTTKSSLDIPWNRVRGLAAGALAVALVAALIIVFWPRIQSLFSRGIYRPAALLPTLSPTPSASPLPLTPTATAIPAATRVVRTPIRTEFALTPISFLVHSTSTSTPVLGMTPSPLEAYESGISALNRGEYDVAVEMMDQVIGANPNRVDAHYFKAEALRLRGDIAEAIFTYDDAVQLDADFAPAYLGRGRVLIERDPQAAIQDFESALRIDPTITDVYLELADYYTSESLWLKLESTMLNALEAGVTRPLLYIYLSQAQLNQGKNVEALENALEGSAGDPSLLEGYLAVGRAYVSVGVNEFEISHLNAALWPLETYLAYVSDDHRGLAALGRALIGLKELERASEVIERAVEINDRYAPALLARGILYTEMGNLTAALDDLTAVQRYATETYDLFYNLGRLHLFMENTEQAINYINEAIEAASDEPRLVHREKKLAQGYALRALWAEANPEDMDDYAVWNWRLLLELSNIPHDTRIMAEQHLAELTGQAPTRTPTSSPTPTATTEPTSTEVTPTVTSSPAS